MIVIQAERINMRFFLITTSITIGLCSLLFSVGCEPKRPNGYSLSTHSQQREWKTGLGPGVVFITEHYRIFTSTGDNKLKRTLPGFMEACYQNYLKLTELPETDKKLAMPMYMMANRREWLNLTMGKFGKSAETISKLEAGGYTYKGITVCWNIGYRATYSVAAHEGMHQFLYNRMKNKLPIWAEEGLASNSEGYIFDPGRVRFVPKQNVSRLVNLRHAILGGYWIPLKRLIVTSPVEIIRKQDEKAVGYYGQVWALVNMLRNDETYGPRWRKMMTAAETGKFSKFLTASQLRLRGPRYNTAVGRKIFEYYINKDVDAFAAEYKKYCRKLVKLQPLE